MNESGKSPQPTSIYQRRQHHRSLPGESSGDEDRPLEMSIGKLTPMIPPENTEDSRPRHTKSRSQFRGRMTTLDDNQAAPKQFHRFDYFHPDETNSAPEIPAATRPRGRSVSSLGSEEDILDRRMNGLAGGLMGLHERAQTPGPLEGFS
jgi:battenin